MVTEAIENRPGRLRALVYAYLQRRYSALFYLLLITMVAVPLFAALQLTGALIELLLAASLLAAVMPVGSVRSRRALLAIAALVWLAAP